MERKPDENHYLGVIIAESLAAPEILQKLKITQTVVEPVTEAHQTPWLAQWSLHHIEIPAGEIKMVAEAISQALDPEHGGSWYADFRNANWHYIIFRGRIFKIDRSKPEQYAEVTRYGVSLGIPVYQLDFSPVIQEWQR